MDLVCVTCGFKAVDGNAMADHMIETQHGVDPEMLADMADSGGLAEFTQMLTLIQGISSGMIGPDNLPAGATVGPIDPDDPTVPSDVRAMMEKLDAGNPDVSFFCTLDEHTKCDGNDCACACHQKTAPPIAPPDETAA